MSTHDPPATRLARSRDPSASTPPSRTSKSARGEKPLVSPKAQPEEIPDRIRTLVTDHSLLARRMAVEAAARFPDHTGIQNAKRILADGKATVGSGGAEPETEEEFDWLRHPPDSARGKWVALVGSELVGSADSLRELTTFLRTKKFSKPALVHRIDPETEHS